MGRDPTCGAVNAGELARIFGVSRRWIYKLKDKGLPQNGRFYDVATCVQWELARITEKGDDEPADIMEARRHLYIAQTKKTELETARLRGSLVNLEEARSLLQQIAGIVASQLDAVGPRLAAQVAGEEDQKTIQLMLFEEHRAIRESIASAIVGLPAPGSADHPSAAEADSGPVGRREAKSAAGVT